MIKSCSYLAGGVLGVVGTWALQLFPKEPLTALQSLSQAFRPRWLKHWEDAKEIWVGFPSCSPSLTPRTPHPRGHRDRGTSQHSPTSLCPALALLSLSRSLSYPELHVFPLPKTLCPRLPFPGTSLPTVGSLPGEDRGAGQPLGLAGPKGGCYCYFPAWKETL